MGARDQSLAYAVRKLNAPNGVATMGRDILAGILASGLPVDMFSDDRWEPQFESRLACYRLPRRVEFPQKFDRLAARRFLKWVAVRCADFAKRRRFVKSSREVLVVNGFGCDFVWDFLGGPRPKKSVLVVHDDPTRFDLPGQRPLEWALELMEKYSHLIFVSSEVRGQWLANPPIAAKQSCTIPNCCAEDVVEQTLALDRAEVRRRLGFGPDELVVACVGTIEYRKGHDLLVSCFPQVRAEVPSASLVLVGAPGGPRPAWGGELLERHVVADPGCGIRAVGSRSDALEFIYAADVFVLPSRCEALPVTILEAMALGTPVIASEVNGIPEEIEHGKSGLLFRSEDAEGLARSLVKLARDAELRQELSENARSRYWELFSRELLVSRYADAMRKLVRDEKWE